MEFPTKQYDVIYADPPWSYENKSVAYRPRGTVRYQLHKLSDHYESMSLDQIQELPIKSISKKDCALFLWVTVPLLPEGLETLQKWGFKYKTMLTWRKILSHGMGYWFNGQTEHLLLGIRGKVTSFRCREPNFLQASVIHKMHSQKPDKFRSLIERATKKIPNCERIELFARTKIHGWDAWGNQLDKTPNLELFNV